jgi:GTPase SAR1 family protein
VVEGLLIRRDIALNIKDKTGAAPLDICCTGTGADFSQTDAIGRLLEVLFICFWVVFLIFICLICSKASGLEQALNHDNVPWNRSRITLVGQGRAGKTALANNLMGKRFQETPSTIGIEKFERQILHGEMREGALSEFIQPDRIFENLVALVAASKTNLVEHDRPAVEESETMLDWIHDVGRDLAITCFLEQRNLLGRDVDQVLFHKCLAENIFTNSKFLISLYDFGGQDIFSVFLPFFMCRPKTYSPLRSLFGGIYLIVFDMQLFLSSDTGKSELCMKYLKFWLNSVGLYTSDPFTNKLNCSIAIIGTRGDKITAVEDYEKISSVLETKICPSHLKEYVVRYPTSEDSEFPLFFFPVDNTGEKSFSSSYRSQNYCCPISRLLTVMEENLEQEMKIQPEVSLLWIKAIDKLKTTSQVSLACSEMMELCYGGYVNTYLLSFVVDVPPLLSFLVNNGIVIWFDEPSLRDLIILDPIRYFVEPLSLLICKHIATKDDPYPLKKTKHEEEIHKQIKRGLSKDWFRMLEYGLVSRELIIELLKLAHYSTEHISKIMVLAEKFSLFVPINLDSTVSVTHRCIEIVEQPPSAEEPPLKRRKLLNLQKSSEEENVFNNMSSAECSQWDMKVGCYYFVPSLLPESPHFLTCHHRDHETKNLIQRLESSYSLVANHFEAVETFYFGFCSSSQRVNHPLYCVGELSQFGFLPNGVFERFVGKLFVTVSSCFTPSDSSSPSIPDDSFLASFLNHNNFLLFKDVIRLEYHQYSLRIFHSLQHNLLQVEVANGCEYADSLNDMIALHDSLFRLLQTVLREFFPNLKVFTLLPIIQRDQKKKSSPDPAFLWQQLLVFVTDQSSSRINTNEIFLQKSLLLPLSELMYLTEKEQRSINLSTKNGRSIHNLSSTLLKEQFGKWLGIKSVHPEKNHYENIVRLLLDFYSSLLFCFTFLLVGYGETI